MICERPPRERSERGGRSHTISNWSEQHAAAPLRLAPSEHLVPLTGDSQSPRFQLKGREGFAGWTRPGRNDRRVITDGGRGTDKQIPHHCAAFIVEHPCSSAFRHT